MRYSNTCVCVCMYVGVCVFAGLEGVQHLIRKAEVPDVVLAELVTHGNVPQELEPTTQSCFHGKQEGQRQHHRRQGADG